MPREVDRSNGSFKNLTESRESNYQEELNSRKFMRMIFIADYFSGILGYNVSLADADSSKMKWNHLPLPLLISLLFRSLTVAKIRILLGKDVYEALQALQPSSTALAITIQRFRVLHVEMKWKEIYGRICRKWDEELQNGISDEIIKNARKHLLFSKLYITLILITWMTYLIRPFEILFTNYVLNGNGTFTETNILPAAYPFAIDTMWKWILCNFLEAYVISNSVMMGISNDSSFFHMCALLSLQIQAFGDKLKNIVEENDTRTNDERLEKRLLEMGRQHCELREICEKVEDAFNPGILSIMIIASIDLCACAISVEKALSDNHFGAAATSVFHFSGIMIETAMYCNRAEDISHQLEKISLKIYESQWFGCSKKFKKMMIMIMMRCNIPFKFRTYGFYNVDRIQLTKIIALTYNLVVALRNIRSIKMA